MLLRTREPSLGLWTGIDTTEIARTSRLVSRLTGYPVQPNKAIVGRNAFAHEAGIHQDGVLKERATYEIMDATTVGLRATRSCWASTPAATRCSKALEEMGFKVDGQALNTAFKRFKEIADRKKQVTAMDLEALVTDELRGESRRLRARVVRGRGLLAAPAARARVACADPTATPSTGAFTGDGPVDAIFHAINAATRRGGELREFRIDAVTEGQDALGEVSVVRRGRRLDRRRPGRLDRHHRGRRARVCAGAVGRRRALRRPATRSGCRRPPRARVERRYAGGPGSSRPAG